MPNALILTFQIYPRDHTNYTDIPEKYVLVLSGWLSWHDNGRFHPIRNAYAYFITAKCDGYLINVIVLKNPSWWNMCLTLVALHREHNSIGRIPVRCNRWSLGMDKLFHPTLYWAYNYLSMLGLKLTHVSKRGPRWFHFVWHVIASYSAALLFCICDALLFLHHILFVFFSNRSISINIY